MAWPRTVLWPGSPKMAIDRNQFFDFVLLCGRDGVAVRAHRYAVCCHSPILNALFTSGCEDSQKQTVELHDFDTVVVSKMLSLIYEGLDNSTSSAALHLLAVRWGRGDGTAKSGLLRSPKTPLRGYVKEHSCEFSGQTDPTSSRYSPFLLPFT